MAEHKRSEKEKMIAGELYEAWDPELMRLRKEARRLTRLFNSSTEEEKDKRTQLLKQLFGKTGNMIDIEPPFHCDYGWNISVGDGFYMNFDCVILDVCPVTIGKNCLCAPKVQIYTATHPIEAAERIKGPEGGKPIKIGDNCWLGGGCIICPGVTLGDGVVVGAGAVVTKSFPSNVIIAGNPAKIIRYINGAVPPESSASSSPAVSK